ncbi:TPA: uroporphyrinogen-III decarboxylase-like protein [Candidatus Poribacteria bacterium]|nr:uroporphyrinogen-III decarboxylase-like protein [Candidatus Poribacteria bacterium]
MRFRFKPDPDFSRLRKTLLREEVPERVPFYELSADWEIIVAVTDEVDNVVDPEYQREVEAIEERAVRFYYMLGYDYVPAGPGINLPRHNILSATDTAELSRGERTWVDEHHGTIETMEDFERYPWPSPQDIDLSNIERIGRNLPDGMMVIGSTSGVLENVMWLMGYEVLSFALYDDPDPVEAMFERVGRLLLAAHEAMADMDCVGALVLGDDMGFKTATMISPDHLRRYVFPWQRRIVKAAHRRNKPLILHSCGNLEEVMEDLIQYVGIDAKHSFEDEIMPVTEFKRIYGDRVAVLGGVDVGFLCRATPDEVRRYVRNVLETCAPNGGYCLGTGNSVANYIKVENYLTMLDEGLRWG